MNGSCALTTFDNPFDPFERFSDWFWFDVGKGYNTCSYLARIAKTSEQFSADIDVLRQRATPRASTTLSTAKMQKITSMNASGYSTSEIAEALGISTSTVSNYLK